MKLISALILLTIPFLIFGQESSTEIYESKQSFDTVHAKVNFMGGMLRKKDNSSAYVIIKIPPKSNIILLGAANYPYIQASYKQKRGYLSISSIEEAEGIENLKRNYFPNQKSSKDASTSVHTKKTNSTKRAAENSKIFKSNNKSTNYKSSSSTNCRTVQCSANTKKEAGVGTKLQIAVGDVISINKGL